MANDFLYIAIGVLVCIVLVQYMRLKAQDTLINEMDALLDEYRALSDKQLDLTLKALSIARKMEEKAHALPPVSLN